MKKYILIILFLIFILSNCNICKLNRNQTVIIQQINSNHRFFAHTHNILSNTKEVKSENLSSLTFKFLREGFTNKSFYITLILSLNYSKIIVVTASLLSLCLISFISIESEILLINCLKVNINNQ